MGERSDPREWVSEWVSVSLRWDGEWEQEKMYYITSWWEQVVSESKCEWDQSREYALKQNFVAASASAWRETKFCLVKMVSPSKKGQNSAEAKYWYFASALKKKGQKTKKMKEKLKKREKTVPLGGFFKIFGVVVHSC